MWEILLRDVEKVRLKLLFADSVCYQLRGIKCPIVK